MTDVREVYEMTAIELAEKLLNADKERVFVAVQIPPAVRVMIGEKFGLARGEDAMPKLSFALRALGADAVLDTAIAQDVITLTQVQALKNKKEYGGAPVVAGKGSEGSCPGEMTARLVRKYYTQRECGKSVRVIAVVCCEKAKGKIKGADVVLTANELAEMIAASGINLRLMEKVSIDMPFGVACGAAYICAACGGKAEAVARCLMENKTRAAAQKLAYSGLYGKGAIKEAVITAGGQEWKFAVVVCPEAAEKVRADIENGVCEYDFVEFSCGGCISKGLENDEDKERTLKLRGLGLRYLDKAHAARSADMNSYAALALKEWTAMVRSGEACAEIAPITEEELQPAPVVEEVVEAPVEEMVVEEVVEGTVVEETPVEETVEEVVEEAPVEETVEEVVEEAPVEVEEEEDDEDDVVEDVAIAEEAVEEFVEETAEDIADVIVEDLEEEIVETAVEEISAEEIAEEVLEKYGEDATEEEIREVVEEIVEESLEDAIEEYVEDVVEEFVEEHLEETVEDAVEDMTEEMVDDIVEDVETEAMEEVEETITDALVEDAVEELIEETTEEATEELVDRVVDELVEKTMEALEEETVEEAVEEAPVQETVVEEAPVEEIVEEVVEEAPVEETVEEAPVEETPVEEEIAFEDMSEEERAKRDPYYRRLSNKERRKLKRQNKNNK